MPRMKKGVRARRRHKKILKYARGYRGARSRNYRAAKQAVMRAWASAYRDRRKRKGDFRKLWISRINAATRAHDMSYSRFINGLKLAEIEINRKMLADLTINDPQGFAELVDIARQKLNS